MKRIWILLLAAAAFGCQGQRDGSGTELSGAQPDSTLDFLDGLDNQTEVSRADLLRGLVLARAGHAGASFSDNVYTAKELGIGGTWEQPSRVVTIGEASTAAVTTVNGSSIGGPEATRMLADRGLIRAERSATDRLSGPELVTLVDGLKELLDSGAALPSAPARTEAPSAKTQAAAPPPAPPTRSAAKPAETGASTSESFEEFGGPKAAPPPKRTTVAAPPARDVPTARREPLPDMTTPPSTATPPPPASPPPPPAPAPVPTTQPPSSPQAPPTPAPSPAPAAAPKPKKTPWAPGTPVPQKP